MKQFATVGGILGLPKAADMPTTSHVPRDSLVMMRLTLLKHCGKFLTDFLNFKFLLQQLSLYIQQNSLSGIRKNSLHC